jgi:ATP-binding cassette subfamily B protein
MRLRTELYAYLHSLPLKFHDQRRSADSSFRVAYDSQSMQAFYSKGFFIFQSVDHARHDLRDDVVFRLALSRCSRCSSCRSWCSRFTSTRNASATNPPTVAERESAVLTVAQEGLSSVKMVQAFGREEDEVGQFRTSARESLDANLKLNATSMKSALHRRHAHRGEFGASCITSARCMSSRGKLTMGQTSGIYLSRCCSCSTSRSKRSRTSPGPSRARPRVRSAASRCSTRRTTCRMRPTRSRLPPRAARSSSKTWPSATPADREILTTSTCGSPGQTVAFVGGTGAGKSTLLSLVPRFYDPTAGRVLIDGHDLRAVQKKSLRNQISIVLQDTLLFSTTVRENIAYGRPGRHRGGNHRGGEARAGARLHHGHARRLSFASRRARRPPERGPAAALGIARAFLKNAPILILDEPTSALDPTTEAAIMQTIEELMRGRTTLIITHRIATVHGVEQNRRARRISAGNRLSRHSEDRRKHVQCFAVG